MDETQAIKVTCQDGFLGWLEAGERPEDSDRVTVRTEYGARIILPSNLFVPVTEKEYLLPLRRDQLEPDQPGATRSGAERSASGGGGEKMKANKSRRKKRERSSEGKQGVTEVIPVVSEELNVSTQKRMTGKVRVTKQVSERVETVDEPVFREAVDVERRPVDRLVDTPPEVRVEGDTTIIPVIEEVLVVEKRYRVKEEIRVTRTRTEEKNPQSFNLRSEEVKVEHIQAGENQDETGGF